LLDGLDGETDQAVLDTEYPTKFILRSSTAVPPA
jgi:hypothetical protein